MAERQSNFLHDLLAMALGGDPAGAYGDMPPVEQQQAVRQAPASQPSRSSPQNTLLAQMSEYFTPLMQNSMAQAQAQANNPFLVFPNRGFFGRHPRVTGALEGALLGAATTGPSATAGEGISNVARSVLGLPQAAQDIRNQRALEPLKFAQPLMQMMQLQRTIESQDIENIERLQRGNYYASLAAENAAKQPEPFSGSAVKLGGKSWAINQVTGELVPLTDPTTGQQVSATDSGGMAGVLLGLGGKTEDERAQLAVQYADMIEAEDPDTAAWLRRFAAGTQARKVTRAAASAGGTATASTRARIREGVETPDAQVRDIGRRKSRLERDIRRADDEAKTTFSSWLMRNRGVKAPEGKTKADLYNEFVAAARAKADALETELEQLEAAPQTPAASAAKDDVKKRLINKYKR